MLQTPGAKTLQRYNYYDNRIWGWEDKTLEGSLLTRELWEKIPLERITRLARRNMGFFVFMGSVAFDDAELKDFEVVIKDDGVYVNYALHGHNKERITQPRCAVQIEMMWIGVLFSPDLRELKDKLPEAKDKEALLLAYGFSKTLWRASYAQYANGIYYVKVDDGVITMNF